MRYIKDTVRFDIDRESVVTLGKFDGLHLGHEKLIQKVLEIGRNGYKTVMFTFDVSPMIQLGLRTTQNILTNEERRNLVEKKGLEILIECPFISEIRNMGAENFVSNILVEQLKVAYIVVGEDFRFGHDRKGDVQLLRQLGPRYGFEVLVIKKEKDPENSREISSTYIREQLQKGNLEKVNELLGYPYFVDGEIVHGRQVGRTMGLPTINQIPDKKKLLPPRGVYASKTIIENEEYYGITNIGTKPTVEGAFVGVETYLFDCKKDLYGKQAHVELFHYQREEKKFDSLTDLKEQIIQDEQTGRQFFRRIESKK